MTEPVTYLVEPDDAVLLARIAQLHIEVIDTGFLSTLGPRVLKDFYRTIAESEGSFVVAALSESREVLGFIAGSAGTHSLYREHLRLRSWRSLARLTMVLARPSRIRRILETLRYSESGAPDDAYPDAEILNFVVDPTRQRGGLGQVLMSALSAEFVARGIPQIRIVTGASQMSAQQFYRKMGATLVGDLEVHAGTQSSLFLWAPTARKITTPITDTPKQSD